jgi:hypothetical protein
VIDDRGYLVTEMVWEDIEDTEPDTVGYTSSHIEKSINNENSINENANNAKLKKVVPTGSKRAKKNISTGEQTNMMSFFTKK